ncbi:MAG: hypothetical protein ACRDR6_17025 [Pseudonocardiaceae bacterium]
MSTTVLDLLDALRAHLAEFELPESYSVQVITASGQLRVTMQLAAHHPSQIVTGLLTWASTLSHVTAEAWREPGGDSVHLSVTGNSPRASQSASTAPCPSPRTAPVPISPPTPARSCPCRPCATSPPPKR